MTFQHRVEGGHGVHHQHPAIRRGSQQHPVSRLQRTPPPHRRRHEHMRLAFRVNTPSAWDWTTTAPNETPISTRSPGFHPNAAMID
jgi:hypothetical protein